MVKLDQSHVETVIPQAGREMLIVNGAYRGQKAVRLFEKLKYRKYFRFWILLMKRIICSI